MTPRQSCNNLLRNSEIRECLGEGPHVHEIPRREPRHFRKVPPQIGGHVLGGGTASDYAAFVSSEIDKWTQVAKQTGATVD